jgi:beta-lactamase regulating signal transducer with metallopeptidase domain
MNLALPTGPLAQAIGWALLHVLWQGAVIAALLAVLLAVLSRRSANLRYAVSCAALALIVVLGVATAIRSYPSSSTIPSAPKTLLVDRAAGSSTSLTPVRPDAIRGFVRAANDRLPAVVTLWLLGVALFSVRLIVDWLRAQRLVTRSASPASDRWQAAARRLGLALGVRQVVRLLESAVVEVPAVIGIVRPAILLPATTLCGLTPAQIEMILAHELAHIRRQDFLVNLLQAVVETLLFYHPAVWWISRRVRIERENCCDDLAIAVCGNRLQYARALTRLEELRAPALSIAASANGGSLLERIRRIVGRPAGATGHAVRGAAAFAVLSCVLFAFAAPSFPTVGASTSLLKLRRDVAWAGSATKADGDVAHSATAGEPTNLDSRDLAVVESAEPPPVAARVEGSDSSSEEDANDEADTIDSETDADDAPEDGRPSLDDLIAMRVHNVTPALIREMRSLFPRIELKEIAGMSAVGATPEFVRELRRVGLQVRSASDAQGLAALGITGNWVRAMRSTGIAVETARDAQGMKATGVTPEFVRDIRSAGLDVESAEEAQGLAALGVTAAFIQDMRSAGLRVDSAKEAQGLAALGVTAAFIRSIRATGLEIRSAQDVQGLAATGVTAKLVRGMQAAGIAVTSASEAQGLAALGVTPEFVRELRDAGVEITDASDAQSLRALNITPQFVRRLAKAGYRNLTVGELSRLGAAGVTGDFVREMSKYKSQ